MKIFFYFLKDYLVCVFFAPMVLCKVHTYLSMRCLFIYILSALIDALIDALIIANTWCMEDFRL